MVLCKAHIVESSQPIPQDSSKQGASAGTSKSTSPKSSINNEDDYSIQDETVFRSNDPNNCSTNMTVNIAIIIHSHGEKACDSQLDCACS